MIISNNHISENGESVTHSGFKAQKGISVVEEIVRNSASEQKPFKEKGCLLAGIIPIGEPVTLTKQNVFRKYVGAVTSVTTMQGAIDTDTKSIVYNIGARWVQKKSGKDAFDVHGLESDNKSTGASCDLAIRSPEHFEMLLVGAAKKYAHFTPDYEFFDLLAIVERLGAGIAYFSATGQLSEAELRGYAPFEVTALGHISCATVASRGNVFIPRSVSSPLGPNAFSALVNATNGCGATVITDVAEVNVGNNKVVMPMCAGAELAAGCYEALRILGGMYDMANSGELYAYALTRGIHKVLTVVGHSDEGGAMRDVLRVGSFATPYGGIAQTGMTTFCGLPRPPHNNLPGWIAFCDSIALATAGLVAYADPCVLVNGMTLPTVIVNDECEAGTAGSLASKAPINMSGLSMAFSAAGGAFSPIYVALLAKLFCIKSEATLASAHLAACFPVAAREGSRHLSFPSVAPFYWIEPTSIVPISPSETVAGRAGFAAICSLNERVTKPVFEECAVMNDGGAGIYCANVQWRTARTSAALMHLWNHKLDGVANIMPRQVEVNGITLVGPLDGNVYSSLSRGDDLSKYMWRRGDCPLPHPAELSYTAVDMCLAFKAHSISDDGWQIKQAHMWDASELANASVTFWCSRPNPIKPGANNVQDTMVRRTRDAAACALSSARLGGASFVLKCQAAISFSAPMRSRRAHGLEPACASIPSINSIADLQDKESSSQSLQATEHLTQEAQRVGVVGHLEPVRAPVRAYISASTEQPPPDKPAAVEAL